jgi:SAM-dependent methyltransferase
MDEIEQIARCMALYSRTPDVQLVQTGMRKRIVDAWGIRPGSKILEVGCGQGDLTAVLAHACGPEGHVEAFDLASPDYGAPVTIGDSADCLLRSPLGSRICFHLGCDLFAGEIAFSEDAFDYVVFAHCSWYFDSVDLLKRTLIRIRPWARQLCLSEWDLVPREPRQLAHALAVLIQGQVEAFRRDSMSNIRTPATKEALLGLLLDLGWDEPDAASIDSTELQDAHWEIEECLRSTAMRAADLGLPPRFLHILDTELGLLRNLVAAHGAKSLTSFAILATKTVDLHAGLIRKDI